MIKKASILCCMALMATIGVFSLNNGKAHAMDTYLDIDYVTYYASTPSVPQALKNGGHNIDIPKGAFYQMGPRVFVGWNPDHYGFYIAGPANRVNAADTKSDPRPRSTYKTYTNNSLGHPTVWSNIMATPNSSNHYIDAILYRQITDSSGTEVWKRTAYQQVYADGAYNSSPRQVEFQYDFNGNYLAPDTYMIMFSDPTDIYDTEISFYQNPYPYAISPSEWYRTVDFTQQ